MSLLANNKRCRAPYKTFVLVCLITLSNLLFAQDYVTVNSIQITTAGAQKSYLVNQEGVLKPGFSLKAATHGAFFIRANTNSNGLPTPAKNSIRVETFQDKVTSESAIVNTPFPKKLTSIEYVDGLGKALQRIDLRQSPSERDIVAFQVYDKYGREPKKFLGYTIPGNGAFRLEAENEQKIFYSETPEVAVDSEPYSIQEFYESPLNQVKKSYSQGWKWHNDAEVIPATGLFRFNTSSEVIHNWNTYGGGLPSYMGSYAEGKLMVTEANTSSGLTKLEYKDSFGRLIMEKEGTGTLWRITYYIYDFAGNVCFVFPPEAVSRLTEFTSGNATQAQEFLDRWCFQYKYDSYNRQTDKRLPGADWVYMIYDKWDRLVYTQDGEQRLTNQWVYTKYDIFNRPIITGITTGTRSTLVSSAGNTNIRFESRANNAIGYTNTAPPSHSAANIFSISYYDDYAFLNYTTWDDNGTAASYAFVNESGFPKTTDIHQLPYPQSTQALSSVKGYQTGTKNKILGTSSWLNAVTYYDKDYRVIQAIAENHLGSRDRATTLYDFTGKTLKTLQRHGDVITVQKEYTYDHAGREKRVYHEINNGPKIVLSDKRYNELGQLVEKNFHSVDLGTTYLQSVDYRYNIQGWLTHINNSQLSNDGQVNNDDNDLFGMELLYNPDPILVGGTNTKKLYHGNISAIRWKTNNLRDAPNEKIYAYDYDVFDRLNEARFATQNGSLWNGSANMFNEAMTYDINGNIKTLKRNGKVNNATAQIDDLVYHYSSLSKKSSNALRHVVDKSTYWSGDPSFGYTETAVTHGNFVSDVDGQNNTEHEYYLNGNLKSDLNKEILSITYNHLNYPERIQMSNNREILYTYDALGNKLKAVVQTTSPVTVLSEIDYVGAIQYVNGKLASFETLEGRVVRATTGYEYEYFIKDHQQNVRVVFGAGGRTDSYLATMETVRATQENSWFKNIVRDATFNHTTKTAEILAPNQAAKLNAAISGGKAVGPAKILTVRGGDNIQTKVFGRYTTELTGTNTIVTNLAALVTSAYGLAATGETKAAYDAITGYLPAKAAEVPKFGTLPKAYLCYILLEKTGSTFTPVEPFGFYQIDDRALNNWQELALDIHIPETFTEGDIYIYVANETKMNTNTSVYFDDFSIVHQSTASALQVYQTSDYYPFGLSFNTFEAERNYYDGGTASVVDVAPNSKLFQEQELQRGFNIGWYHYKYRMHDPALGRFFALDPLAEKYMYNSVYAFSENRLVDGIELEGAEYLSLYQPYEYTGNWYDAPKFLANTIFPAFNTLPQTWNSLYGSLEHIYNNGFGSYGNQLGNEFADMGSGLSNYFGEMYRYHRDTPFSFQLSDAGNAFTRLETYEQAATMAFAMLATKSFSVPKSLNYKPNISLGGGAPSVVVNSKGVAYPKVHVGGFGEVPFPRGQITKVVPSPPNLRSEFNKIRNSGEFRTWWEGQGRPWPTPTQGSRIDIHHIQPLGHGGTNAFENLVPLDYNSQHKLFNSWWLSY